MKAIARSYFWWKGLDQEIETLVKSCLTCLAVKSAPASVLLHPWVWPNAPLRRIHINFAGPFLGKMFLIIVDAHSKWPEVYCHVFYHFTDYHRNIANLVFSLWPSGTSGIRQ